MPRINLDLNALSQDRSTLQSVVAEQRGLDTAVLSQKNALEAAQRASASTDTIAQLQQALRDAEAARQRLIDQRREIEQRVDRFADGLVRNQDPAVLAQALDGRQPIALLPMRLETRYFPPGQPTSLRIRIYPDNLNTIEHTPAPSQGEMAAAVEYWNARFTQDDAGGRTHRA